MNAVSGVSGATARPCVILDRDGTLSVECGFVTRAEDLRVFPQSLHAVRRLHEAGYLLVVVTNQSGIARGLYDEAELARVHERMQRELESLPRAYLHCPHHPDPQFADGGHGRVCDCRKPGSGMLLQAERLFGPIDWAKSFLVGDAARDLLMGANFKAQRILVKSGKPWETQVATLAEAGCEPHHIATDLRAATDWILSR